MAIIRHMSRREPQSPKEPCSQHSIYIGNVLPWLTWPFSRVLCLRKHGVRARLVLSLRAQNSLCAVAHSCATSCPAPQERPPLVWAPWPAFIAALGSQEVLGQAGASEDLQWSLSMNKQLDFMPLPQKWAPPVVPDCGPAFRVDLSCWQPGEEQHCWIWGLELDLVFKKQTNTFDVRENNNQRRLCVPCASCSALDLLEPMWRC